MIHRIPLTLARSTLGQIVKRVHRDKDVMILERDGVPMAAIIDIEELEDWLESRDPDVAAAIALSRQDYAAGRARPADALLAEIEAEG